MSEIPGWATRDPLKLCPCVRSRWLDFAERAPAPLVLIETLRDLERQRYYYNSRVSRTLKSKHLPQPPNGLSLAFDTCPREYLRLKGWAPDGGLWYALGSVGLALGLHWGGSWTRFPDRPHFYLTSCAC